jgi:hypothetical protein
VLALFALACGGGSDSGTADTAAPAAPAAQEKTADVAAPAPAASASGPVEQCQALADQKQWAEALAPCTLAARQKPDDLAIQHALQQAQAAAAQ